MIALNNAYIKVNERVQRFKSHTLGSEMEISECDAPDYNNNSPHPNIKLQQPDCSDIESRPLPTNHLVTLAVEEMQEAILQRNS